jgi:uncharacterized protein YndB with AHSA1/START domain
MVEPVVSVDVHVDASPDKVWAAMTQKKSPMFMGAEMDTDWTPGSKYTLKGDWNGKSFTDHGEIEAVERGKELTFTHWSKTPEPPESYNAVRLTMKPDGKGTKVTLAQLERGKAQHPDDKAKAEYRKNWTMMLDGLKKAAEAA